MTLPLSKTGILGGCVLIALPMFGDYYTPNMVSGAPTTSMLGNQIDLYFHSTSQPTIGAALTIILSLFLVVLMGYYMITVARATQEPRVRMTDAALPPHPLPTVSLWQRTHGWITNPWGRPRFLVLITWGYMVWAIVPVHHRHPVLVQRHAARGRSGRGFSLRWYTWDPSDSVMNDPSLRHALAQSFKLAGADVLIAVPLGVALALGLARWRGRGAGTSNFIMLFPLVTPEIVMGVSLLLVFTHIFTFVHTGTLAQILGHVTFSISYVVVIVRGRLFSIGRQYEEAAADLGASPRVALYRVLLPLLTPAIVAERGDRLRALDRRLRDQLLALERRAAPTRSRSQIYAATRAAPLPSTNAIASDHGRGHAARRSSPASSSTASSPAASGPRAAGSSATWRRSTSSRFDGWPAKSHSLIS